MELAVVAQIVNTHGVKGEVKLYPLMDYPDQLLAYDSFIIEGETDRKILHVKNARLHKQLLIVDFEEIHDMDEAISYKNTYLHVPHSDLPALPKGKYYLKDLEGLSVHTDEDEYLGILTEVLETGARNVFSIKDSSNNELLIPNIEDVVLSIDIANKKMVVHLIPGLRG